MGVEEPSLFVSPQSRWFGHAGNAEEVQHLLRAAEEVRDLLPFPLSSEPTKAEMELYMTSARGEPVSPELIHEAAVDVWMFLLKWSLNWQFEDRKVGDAGTSARQAFPRAPTAAQQAALHHLKQYVEDFVRGPIVPYEDWAIIFKTTGVDYTVEEIKLPEAITWAQIAPALPPADWAARVRSIVLAEGPLRELLRDPMKVLLPPTEWPQPVPQPK